MDLKDITKNIGSIGAMLSEQEATKVIQERFPELLKSDDKGKVIKEITKELQGKVDPKMVTDIVNKIMKK